MRAANRIVLEQNIHTATGADFEIHHCLNRNGSVSHGIVVTTQIRNSITPLSAIAGTVDDHECQEILIFIASHQSLRIRFLR